MLFEKPTSFRACFSFDESGFNPTPKGWYQKWYKMRYNSRYSMAVLLRLAQYYYAKSRKTGKLGRVVFGTMAEYFRRKNQIKNGLTCSLSPQIDKGVIFHHVNVIITEETVIESNVHIYGNVTFGIKNDGAPRIEKNAKIAGNSMVLGGITVGAGSVVAPMSLVLKDVPSGHVVAGIPAKVIGEVNERNFNF